MNRAARPAYRCNLSPKVVVVVILVISAVIIAIGFFIDVFQVVSMLLASKWSPMSPLSQGVESLLLQAGPSLLLLAQVTPGM